MFKRLLQPSLQRSFFLFGPRSTGKSTLLRELLPESRALWLDLLDPELERRLGRSPNRLTAILDQERSTTGRKWVVIDEVQKIPELLSIVQQQISARRFHFALTGSSARKLKRGGANLLGGRASWFELSSLTHVELEKAFELSDVIHWGSLPETIELAEEERLRFLRAYSSIYLKEEIIAEQLVRKVQPFRDFIELAAIQSGQILNYAKFARDCQVDITTIQTYFEILVDTLVGFELPAFHDSIRKRQRTNPKFYFFDSGVCRALAGTLEERLVPRTSAYGVAFENFVITEFRRLMQAYEKDWRLSYLATKDNHEVDLIVERRPNSLALEIKSSDRVDPVEVKKFERLAGDLPRSALYFVSQDPVAQKFGSVHCLHWRDFFKEVF